MCGSTSRVLWMESTNPLGWSMQEHIFLRWSREHSFWMARVSSIDPQMLCVGSSCSRIWWVGAPTSRMAYEGGTQCLLSWMGNTPRIA